MVKMAVFDLLISRKIRVAGKLPNFHTVNPRVFFSVKSVYHYSYMILRKNVKNTFIHVILFQKVTIKEAAKLA